MERLLPYFRLMRLHQPVGIWLLFWPCLWGMLLAGRGLPPLGTLALFALGAVLMRSAGCIVNDMADRRFDREVARTQNRPLASGALSLTQAAGLLAALLLASLGIALWLGPLVVLWGALALAPVGIYPFMKRISWWPQLFLGLTFNWGALMGYAAIAGEVQAPALWLYIGSLFWTLGYDTIYAHQDKHDDLRIGIKSTALRLGQQSRLAIGLFYLLALAGWAMSGWAAGVGSVFFMGLGLVAGHFLWQLRRVEFDSPASCRRMFLSNIWLGGLLSAAFYAGLLS